MDKEEVGEEMDSMSFLLPPLLAALCFSVPPLFLQIYNPLLFTCFLTPYRWDCNDLDIPCTRGSAHGSITGLNITRDVLYFYMLVGNTAVILFMGLLIFAIYKQEKKSDSYLTEGQEKNRKNTRSTAWQGFRFSAAYFVPYVIYYVNFFNDVVAVGDDLVISHAGIWVIYYWLVIMTPLLGAFNSAVYFYPRYVIHRKQHSDKSRMACLFEVLGIDTSRCHCERRGTKAALETASTGSTPLISEEDIQALP